MSDLRPCPFCGGVAVIVQDYQFDCWIVQCDICHSKGATAAHKNTAIEHWTKRSNEPITSILTCEKHEARIKGGEMPKWNGQCILCQLEEKQQLLVNASKAKAELASVIKLLNKKVGE